MEEVSSSDYMAIANNVAYMSGSSNAGYMTEVSSTNYIAGVSPSDYLTGVSNAGYLAGGSNAGYLVGGSNAGYLAGGSNAGYLTGGCNAGYLAEGSNADYMAGGSNAGYMAGGSNASFMSRGGNAGYIAGGSNTGYIAEESNACNMSGGSNTGYMPGGSNVGYIGGGSNADDIVGVSNAYRVSGIYNTDYIAGVSNADYIAKVSNADYTAGVSNADYIAKVSNADYTAGVSNADYIAGGSNVDYIAGVSNAYYMARTNTNNVGYVPGGSIEDSIVERCNEDNMAGRRNEDNMAGGRNEDNMSGGRSEDNMSGGRNEDNMSGGRNEDNMSGGRTEDNMAGGRTEDNMAGGRTEDNMAGGRTEDNMAGGRNEDNMAGGSIEDNMTGGRNEDYMTGISNADSVGGDSNKTHVIGGSNKDHVAGGGNENNFKTVDINNEEGDEIIFIESKKVERSPAEVIIITDDDSTDEFPTTVPALDFTSSVNPILKTLQEIIPDAEPSYLQRVVDEITTDEELHTFVLKAVTEQNYPKITSEKNVNQVQSAMKSVVGIAENPPKILLQPAQPVPHNPYLPKSNVVKVLHSRNFTNEPSTSTTVYMDFSIPEIKVTLNPEPYSTNNHSSKLSDTHIFKSGVKHTHTFYPGQVVNPPYTVPKPASSRPLVSSTVTSDIGALRTPGFLPQTLTHPLKMQAPTATYPANWTSANHLTAATNTSQEHHTPVQVVGHTTTTVLPDVNPLPPVGLAPPPIVIHRPQDEVIAPPRPYTRPPLGVLRDILGGSKHHRRMELYMRRLMRIHRDLINDINIHDIANVNTPRNEPNVSHPDVKTSPESEADKRFALLANILCNADHDYLKKEAANLHDEDSLDRFVIQAFANEDVWNRTLDSSSSVQKHSLKTLESKLNILIKLLPDASPTFLKRDSSNLKTNEEVQEYAAKLLREQNYPKRKNIRSKTFISSKTRKPEENITTPLVSPKYLTLIEMLPDADPDYLLEQSKSLASDADIEAFVLQAVEGKSYPKREEFFQRQEYQKLWKKYIENFDIKEFLLIYPNPFKYFYIEKKNSKNPLDIPLKFLQHRYRRKHADIFQEMYRQTGNNLSKTCDRLDSHFFTKPRKLQVWNGEAVFSTSVLQEIAFIQNRQEIAHYMLFIDNAKAEAYEKAKLEGNLVECGCCYEEKLPEEMVYCLAKHAYCVTCVKRGSDVVIGNGGNKFPCYSEGCNEEFPLDIIQNILNPDIFSRFLVRKQYEEVNAAGIPGLETCPFCEYCFIPPPEDKLFNCSNPLCMKITCRKCKRLDHLPLSCEEFACKETQHKMQSYVEEKMTEALVRTCWQCGAKFVKESGCNMMSCKCGAKMCYVCREPVKNYEHFSKGRCGQDLDTTVHDEKRVISVGQQAKRDMEAANPGFQLVSDPTRSLKMNEDVPLHARVQFPF